MKCPKCGGEKTIVREMPEGFGERVICEACGHESKVVE